MTRGVKGSLLVLLMVLFTFSIVACGGGGSSSGSAIYNGSADPAIADSTTATGLTQYSLGIVQGGSPLAEAFLATPEIMLKSISVKPLIALASTTITIPVPSDAIIAGADYGMGGTGTATIKGSMTLYMYADTTSADTWYVDYGVLDGSIVFSGFSVSGGPTLTGSAAVSSGGFYFSGEAMYSLSEGNFTSDPGLPVWTEVEMTFSNIEVSDDGESWSLGEGDWFMELSPGEGGYIHINSMTVLYEGDTYKLEDALLVITIYPGDGAVFEITGDINDYATFYHPDLGKIWFAGILGVGGASGEIEEGELTFYDGPIEAAALFDVLFAFDESYGDTGATAYWIDFYDESYDEWGYYVDGSFIEDLSASNNFD